MGNSEKQINKKPEQLVIKASKLSLNYDKHTPLYWYYNDAFATHFLEALSITFPQGEKFFVDSVRYYKDKVTDKEQLADISGFIGQEALHSIEHNQLNNLLALRGYPKQSLENHLEIVLNGLRRVSSPQGQLAFTCALEHMTAMFADVFFTFPDTYEQLHPTVRPIWLWHSIEEAEHKGVAYDLYELVDGSYFRRIYYMCVATMMLLLFVSYSQVRLMNKDKSYFNIAGIFKGLWLLFGFGEKAGYMRKQWKTFFSYFKPGFHPWHHDNSKMIAEWRKKVMAMADDVRKQYSDKNEIAS